MTWASPSVPRWLSVRWSPVTGVDLPFAHWSVISHADAVVLAANQDCLQHRDTCCRARGANTDTRRQMTVRAHRQLKRTMGSCVLKVKVAVISLRYVVRGACEGPCMQLLRLMVLLEQDGCWCVRFTDFTFVEVLMFDVRHTQCHPIPHVAKGCVQLRRSERHSIPRHICRFTPAPRVPLAVKSVFHAVPANNSQYTIEKARFTRTVLR